MNARAATRSFAPPSPARTGAGATSTRWRFTFQLKWARLGPSARRRSRLRACVSRQDAELVERRSQLLGVAVDAECPCSGQLVLPVPARQETDGQHLRAPRREQ